MTNYEELARLLSAGLDLCVRARKLDDIAAQAVVASDITGTNCATGAVWVLDQYDADLKTWEAQARAALLQLEESRPCTPPPSPDGEG